MANRADELFQQHRESIYRRTDRMFAVLMAIQYVVGIAAALTLSPRLWDGDQSSVHMHVWAAVILGALIVSLPITLAILKPGRALTRHIIAIGQMLDSALLIHLMGGRIETHFHIFGSLAFLGFYRDWRVLISASLVVAGDHLLRGLYLPQSVYGVLSSSPFRWLEHTGWVIFEDVFITLACCQSIREMREIAERRAQLDSALQAEQAALQAKDTFMSVCGHELRTPLTSLSLQTQLTRRALQKSPPAVISVEKVSKLVEQTDSQVKRLLRLVQDLVEHSGARLHTLDIQPEPVDLMELVKEVADRYRAQAEAAGCSVRVDDNVPVTSHCDRYRIEQVVTNLVTNAVKYAAGGPIDLSLGQDLETARIFVKDHGPGISEEDRSRIFLQFERAASTRHVTGLGLGLHISKNIVERHGGRIQLESELGRGSTFIVEIPIRQAASNP